MTYQTAETKLFNDNLKNVEAVNRRIVDVYSKSQKYIAEKLTDYQLKKMSGEFVPLAEEYRLIELYKQIDNEIYKATAEIESIILEGYKTNIELTYYTHAYNVEVEINRIVKGADYLLNYPVLPSLAVESALTDSVAGWTFPERMGHLRDAGQFTLRGLVAEAIARGDTVKNLAKEIKKIDGWIESYSNRALTNARTEMLRAYSIGNDLATQEAIKSGVQVDYVWSAALDGRTRPDHVIMNRKKAVIENGRPVFTLPDGSTGEYPRDPNLSAGESINCRCRRLDLPSGIEPTEKAVKLPDGNYERIPWNVNSEEWVKKNYGIEI